MLQLCYQQRSGPHDAKLDLMSGKHSWCRIKSISSVRLPTQGNLIRHQAFMNFRLQPEESKLVRRFGKMPALAVVPTRSVSLTSIHLPSV